jgi:toxin ParE1/3/4
VTRLRLSAPARADIAEILAWTVRQFGILAQERYARLLEAALADLQAEPQRTGSVARPEIGGAVRSYHLRHSKKGTKVARPRHLILYRIGDDGTVEIGRVLHDAMELDRHAQFDFSRQP